VGGVYYCEIQAGKKENLQPWCIINGLYSRRKGVGGNYYLRHYSFITKRGGGGKRTQYKHEWLDCVYITLYNSTCYMCGIM